MAVTIYHNPRCNKSRQTLTLLEERGVKPRIVEYLKTPPTPPSLSGSSSCSASRRASSCARRRRPRPGSTSPVFPTRSSSPAW